MVDDQQFSFCSRAATFVDDCQIASYTLEPSEAY